MNYYSAIQVDKLEKVVLFLDFPGKMNDIFAVGGKT